MNLEKLDVVQLNAEETKTTRGGDWSGVLFDLYYVSGADWVHYKCGKYGI
jgi:hypothetical protein